MSFQRSFMHEPLQRAHHDKTTLNKLIFETIVFRGHSRSSLVMAVKIGVFCFLLRVRTGAERIGN